MNDNTITPQSQVISKIKITNVVITNIIEISQLDYNEFKA
jgi:hypothetical protein